MKPVKRGPWAVAVLVLMFLAPGVAMGQYVLGTTTTTVASDAASNYSDAEFKSSTNKGSGFSGWTLDAATPNGGFAGRFIGSSAIGASSIDTDAKSFGLFANSGNNAVSGATRAFGRSLRTGDSFTISVAVNFRGGNKGFDLRNSANSNIVNFNVGSDTYALAGTTLFSNTYDANTVFTFIFTQNATSLDWTVNRSGGLTASQSGTISDVNSGTLTNIRLYNVSDGTNDDGGGARNLYFNSLSITSKHSIPSGETSTLTGDYTAPYVEIQSGGTLDLASHTLFLSSGAILTNNGTFTGGTGTIDFLGTGTIAGSSAITLNNAILRGGAKLANSIINGVLTIATGGFVDDASISHSFGSSSTLRYANNDTYGANKEWRSGEASGVGVPANVEVNGTSIVSFGSSTAFRATGGLNVAPTAGITMSTLPGGDLKVSGNVTLNGTLTDNDRAVFFIGGEDQFLGKSTGDAILSIPYIIIDKDDNSDRIHLSNTALRITRKLTLTRGRLDPNNGSVTLVSDASHSASIDASGTGDIMSTFHVHRHIARTTDPVGSQVLLGSPLPVPFTGSSAGLLSNVWTQGAATGANVTNGNPNVFSYNESNGMTGWAAITNLTTPTDRGKGYLVGLFKDDVAGGEVDGGWPKTLSVTGSWQASENDGSTVTLPVGFTSDVGESLDQRGWNLVSNPFISTIDWNAESGWTRTNIENWYYTATESGTMGVFNHTTNVGTQGLTRFIAPFQGFWVKANAADPVLTVTDAIKAPDNQQSLNKSSDTPAFWIELTDDLGRSTNTVLTFGSDGRLGADRNDAPMMPALRAGVQRVGTRNVETGAELVMQHLPVLEAKEHVTLVTDAPGRNVRIRLSEQRALPQGWSLVLVDSETGNRYDLMNESWTGVLSTDDFHRFDVIIDPTSSTSTKDDGRGTMDDFALEQNYPNPFNPSTQIRFTLRTSHLARLTVYDVLGREVAVLVNGTMPAGAHSVTFDASNLTSGVYMYKLEAGGMVMAKRMTVVK